MIYLSDLLITGRSKYAFERPFLIRFMVYLIGECFAQPNAAASVSQFNPSSFMRFMISSNFALLGFSNACSIME